MKFLCLRYYNAQNFKDLTPEQLQDIHVNCTPHDKQMWATGKVVAVGSMSMPEQWKHAVPQDGQPAVADGAYVKGDDLAGAFVIVEAENMEEAAAVAFKHPAANYGEHLGFAVEVRPCEFWQEKSPF